MATRIRNLVYITHPTVWNLTKAVGLHVYERFPGKHQEGSGFRRLWRSRGVSRLIVIPREGDLIKVRHVGEIEGKQDPGGSESRMQCKDVAVVCWKHTSKAGPDSAPASTRYREGKSSLEPRDNPADMSSCLPFWSLC